MSLPTRPRSATGRTTLVVEIVAGWAPEDGTGRSTDPPATPATRDASARYRHWAVSVSAALTPVALPGGHANHLGPG
ncbi:hypothetical protein AB0D57_47645 [Streptomyces sp. NPDC048275]|uniref:hypothetical protein n=1 Tax=Streptomyces sp. NPDC048275 TaxID=3155629 RepID=UPI0033FD6DCB